ncbi:hypothetical protein Pla108_09300 [Botrimarina colliarenosi]|uniref:Uncharacterized protein n=1 Tax=Botrimarina colliarenosi TaxID=2528001 RepID=A0A5C6AKK8_9BACT|nr:hypothetical protein [Botrimarina colliarenosi]TWT99986.1 hypothetical protein Pla108_09300 [Botrimarina colliarenosi]
MDHGSRKLGLSAYGLVAALVAAASPCLTGCQSDIAGQTLPSPYYMTDDVQYYAPGPEFKLANEAAAMKAQKEARISQKQP